MTSTSVSMASPTVRTDRRKCMLAFCLLLLLAGGSLFVGKFPLTISGILRDEPMQRKVFFTLRLARVEVAVVGGFTLGICGFVYQTVFRNPLASPDVIGVSSGASAGAAAGILFLSSAGAVTASAFFGALAAVGAALALSSLDRSGKKSTIVLAGIGVHALAQTALMCLKLMADPERELASIEYWMMGSLSNVSASRIGLNLAICLVCGAALFPLHRQTVLLSAEEGEARLLGVSVGRVRLLVLTLATLAVAAVVSLTGLISFIGLLAPHGARLLMKGNRKSTMLLSGLLGGCLLCAGDIFARSVAEAELPVSVFTSLIGAPALISLTLGRREEG